MSSEHREGGWGNCPLVLPERLRSSAAAYRQLGREHNQQRSVLCPLQCPLGGARSCRQHGVQARHGTADGARHCGAKHSAAGREWCCRECMVLWAVHGAAGSALQMHHAAALHAVSLLTPQLRTVAHLFHSQNPDCCTEEEVRRYPEEQGGCAGSGDAEEVEMLSALVLTSKITPLGPLDSGGNRESQGMESFPLGKGGWSWSSRVGAVCRSAKGAGRRIQETTGCQPHLCAWKGHRAVCSGCHLQAIGREDHQE